MLHTWTGQCFLQPWPEVWESIEFQTYRPNPHPKSPTLVACRRCKGFRNATLCDPAHLEGLEKGDQGICKWPNSSGCCFKCDHVEFQCDPICSVPACRACDTLLPLCQPTLGPGVDLRRRMGIIMFIINSILYIYIIIYIYICVT